MMNKIIKYLILSITTMLLLYILLKYNNVLLCESSSIADLCLNLKMELRQELFILIKQQDFFLTYRSCFYENIMLKNYFVETFIQRLDLQKLIDNNLEKDISNIKYKIIKEFYTYISEEQKRFEKRFFIDIVQIFIAKTPEHMQHIEQYLNFIKHFDNTEINITTQGFKQYMSEFHYIYIQKFIKQGLGLKICLEFDGVYISITWYTLIFFKKVIICI